MQDGQGHPCIRESLARAQDPLRGPSEPTSSVFTNSHFRRRARRGRLASTRKGRIWRYPVPSQSGPGHRKQSRHLDRGGPFYPQPYRPDSDCCCAAAPDSLLRQPRPCGQPKDRHILGMGGSSAWPVRPLLESVPPLRGFYPRATKSTGPKGVNGSHARPHCADAPVLPSHRLVPLVHTVANAYARDLWFFHRPGSVLHATRFGSDEP